MGSRLPPSLRSRKDVIAVALVLMAVVPFQVAALVGNAPAETPPAATARPPADHDEAVVRALMGLRDEAPPPAPAPSPAPAPRPSATDRLAAFGGLGAWVDVYDFAALDPASTVAAMAARGVRTVYVQTGRFNTASVVAPEVDAWLVAAHAAGLDVVGWYLPGYRNLGKDVKRTVAVARYAASGETFDGVGVDIEFKGEVRHVETWNRRVVRHLERVRAALGDAYPLAAITPPPLQMDVAPLRWAGFPWAGIGRTSDVVMLMSYWSFRDCDNVPDHCAYAFTVKNIEITRTLLGRDDVPIHTIGGVGDAVTGAEVADFARGARAADAFGASLYDYRTTRPRFWPWLERLASL